MCVLIELSYIFFLSSFVIGLLLPSVAKQERTKQNRKRGERESGEYNVFEIFWLLHCIAARINTIRSSQSAGTSQATFSV